MNNSIKNDQNDSSNENNTQKNNENIPQRSRSTSMPNYIFTGLKTNFFPVFSPIKKPKSKFDELLESKMYIDGDDL